jgi:hypothetical protein
MRVLLASEPGAAERPNEDFAAAVPGAVVLLDGASRLADRFQLATWAGIGTILTGEGPAGLIQRVRAAEAADPQGERWPRGKIHDDATAVLWRMAVGSEVADN